jgi:phosphoacetylglucosamine mutase
MSSLPTDLATAVAGAVAGIANAPTTLGYGTAGFRAKATLLDAVFIRVGLLAALRAWHTGRVIGVMVTASHNPVQDNGVKIVDPDGGMLVRRWEKYACDLAGAAPSDVVSIVEAIVHEERIDLASARSSGTPCAVYIAKDTRPSSEPLAARVRAGAEALAAAVTDHGLLTTPQLHFIVRATNAGDSSRASVAGYISTMQGAFAEVLADSASAAGARGPVVIDCANGVGGIAGAGLAEAMSGLGLDMRLRNTGRTPAEVASMNEGCGAEHAQKERLPPLGFAAGPDGGMRCASLDGDADRLVYHYFSPVEAGGAWNLVDGDKIAALAATFVADQLRALGLAVTGEPAHPHAADDYDPFAPGAHGHVAGPARDAVSVGVVQVCGESLSALS